MLDRAENSPPRQAVLLQLRYAEISKILNMSARKGKRGSVNHFVSALRFGLTIWSVTHAVEYVRLATDLLVMMHCASPALKALYANEINTRFTATGESCHPDEIMEKSIGHIRSHCGKVEQAGMAKKLEFQCAAVTNRPTQNQINKELLTGNRSVSYEKSYHECELRRRESSLIAHQPGRLRKRSSQNSGPT
jgi:hypothetical protein